MQLDSSPATIANSTLDPISLLDNTNPCDYETTNVSYILSSHGTQTDFKIEIDDYPPFIQSQKEDLIDTQLWVADTETTPVTISANYPSNDIHLTPPEDKQQKILDFYNEIILYNRSPEAIVNLFLKFRDKSREAVQILRNESYALKKLLANYIITKRPLPPVYWYSENYRIILPINNQDKVKGFIRQLKTEFFFKLSIGPERIKEGLIQSEKPYISSNFSQVEEELRIISDKLNREHTEFTVTVKTIKEKYFGCIPKEWITPILSDLFNLKEAQTILRSESSTITLPIIEDGLLTNKLNALRKIFHFKKLLPEFLIEPESPDSALTLLPKLI
ncbi:15609_t:CDS:2 [Acaulospora colombiana]|uniref:15609_t:CDS:1 n=1 Tax=Acaulospora colombiana TaxID=27376 RepID=A0ACA9M5G3_9GLOM|nr:15609_t:CDS:2 [Acaulospora colombiana]